MSVQWLLLLHVVISTNGDETIVRIGHLYSPGEGGEYNLATLKLAEKHLRRDGVINDSVQFQYFLDSVDANNYYQPAKGLEMLIFNYVDVVIGPTFSISMRAFAQIAVYWDLPLFSYFAASGEMADKSTYQTLVRVAPTLDQLGSALLMAFEAFGWNRIAVIQQMNPGGTSCDVLTANFVASIKQSMAYRVTIAYQEAYEVALAGVELSRRINATLDKIKQKARIVWVCMSDNDPGAARNRQFMITAHQNGMTTGEYVFILSNSHKDTLYRKDPWLTPGNVSDGLEDIAKRAYRAALFFDYQGNSKDALLYVDRMIKSIAKDEPYNQTVDNTVDFFFSNTLRGLLYAALYMYGRAYNVCTTAVGPRAYQSGHQMLNCSRLLSMKGLANETIYMDKNAERLGVYLIESFDENGALIKNLEIRAEHPCGDHEMNGSLNRNESKATAICPKEITLLTPIRWISNDGKLPADSPVCGFDGERCQDQQRLVKVTMPVVLGTFASIALVAFLAYQRRRYMNNLDVLNLVWRIDRKELRAIPKRQQQGSIAGSIYSHMVRSPHLPPYNFGSTDIVNAPLSSGSLDSDYTEQSTIVMYQDNIVRLSKFVKIRATIQFQFAQLRVLKTILSIHHENLNQLFGVCIDEQLEIVFPWRHAAKGSVYSIIRNSDIELDFAFKSAILRDIVNGLEYLHARSSLGYHGFLRSFNCIVSSRWVVQLSEFGMQQLLGGYFSDGSVDLGNLPQATASGKQHDVGDFAIILFQVVTRSSFPDEAFKALSALEQFAMDATEGFLVHRPNWANQNEQLVRLFQQCRSPALETRPTITTVKSVLLKISYGEKSLVDHMVSMMEKYAGNLEQLVGERTTMLQEERRRADQLLYQLLPRCVADTLKQGLPVVPELYDKASVYYSDIVGFTTISSASTPLQVVQMLNLLYQQFDAIIELYDCYKVETIGDAYLVVSGVPKRNGDKHATEIASMALGIMKFATQDFKIPHMPGRQLSIRVGLHSGPLAAGVIGLSMPKYCVFGDTVNIGSRMESSGEPGRIQISWSTHSLLVGKRLYRTTLRGQVTVQETQMPMETYWLEDGRRQPNNNPSTSKALAS